MPRPRRISAERQHEIDVMESQPLVVRCLKCGWYESGPAREARQRAAEHRVEAHPELGQYRRPVANRLHTFQQHSLTDIERDEIQENRRKRAYLAGIDLGE